MWCNDAVFSYKLCTGLTFHLFRTRSQDWARVSSRLKEKQHQDFGVRSVHCEGEFLLHTKSRSWAKLAFLVNLERKSRLRFAHQPWGHRVTEFPRPAEKCRPVTMPPGNNAIRVPFPLRLIATSEPPLAESNTADTWRKSSCSDNYLQLDLSALKDCFPRQALNQKSQST